MIWLDAHLFPRLARRIAEELGHACMALRDVGLRDAEDEEIFDRGREESVILITKDRDFVALVAHRGPPPQIIWLRCGNTTEERLIRLLAEHLNDALQFLGTGESLVEIR